MANKRQKKSDEKKAPTQRVEPYSTELRVLLKPEEIADRADRAATLLETRDSKEEEQKAQSKHAKSIIEQLDAELRRISNEVRTKATYKEVQCERRYLYEDKRVVEVRTDTGEEISNRPMTDIELQQSLPFNPEEPKPPEGGGDLENEFGGGAAAP